MKKYTGLEIDQVGPTALIELASGSGMLPMKIVSQCRKQARSVYYGGVFEIKKGIPDVRLLL
jgi:hypothetical protein